MNPEQAVASYLRVLNFVVTLQVTFLMAGMTAIPELFQLALTTRAQRAIKSVKTSPFGGHKVISAEFA